MANDARNQVNGKRGALMAIGGAKDKVKARRILNAFMKLAGGPSARITIIPAASMHAEYTGVPYRSIFEELDAESVQVLHVDSCMDAQDETRVRMLEET